MHNCVRCGREPSNIEEIHNGCSFCGSKVFVFNKSPVTASDAEGAKEPVIAPAASTDAPAPEETKREVEPEKTSFENVAKSTAEPENSPEPAKPVPSIEEKTEGNGKNESEEKRANGKAPQSYFARTTFTSEDVENIKIVSEGVFLVDVGALHDSPVVLKDEEGVYYVRLPFEQNWKEGNGKKK